MTDARRKRSPEAPAITIKAADLFCGAGGTSTALTLACQQMGARLDLLAINHWDIAIATHRINHPDGRHLCETLDAVNPRHVVPDGHLHLLMASPECTHHSNARGGRPMSDQSRASAWHVLRWAEALRIDHILIENVREFRNWGPIGTNGRPLKTKRGETYRAFLAALRSLGYQVEDRLLNAADFGDPTTRTRLFIMARRGTRPIRWPTPTHAPEGGASGLRKWKPAREIIDWSLEGHSIFHRSHPLAPATLARIEAGLLKFGGHAAEPFIVVLRRHGDARSIDKPLPAITASGQHFGLCEPFVLGQQSCSAPRSLNQPLPTIATAGAIGLVEPFVEPFVTKYYGTGQAKPVSEPLDTITTKDRFALVTMDGQEAQLDIRFRMLQPHELARAMSFDDRYVFTGTREQQIKQVGNAVPVRLAQAHCAEILAGILRQSVEPSAA